MSNLLEKCCLVGDAVGGDPTHFMIEAALADLGLDWRFLSFQTAEDRLAEALAGLDALGLVGVRLRGPFADKPAGIETLTSRAKRTGRLTHLTRHEERLQGDDATGPALIEALAEVGEPEGKRVVVLGAGGAAPSLVDVLVECGAASVAVADASADRAAAVVLTAQTNPSDAAPSDALATETRTLTWEGDWIELPEGTDWIISTASWPKEENERVAATLAPELHAGQAVIDLAIGSNRSPLQLAALSRDATLIDGLPILLAETALAVEAWTNLEVDRAVLRDAAEEFLGV
ncbi:Shikimate dehydrogenase [Planctomycetes bacterium MalM25]|nr:Shikimate dehydrogenase [Planctomycetes bacterium MalM25]